MTTHIKDPRGLKIPGLSGPPKRGRYPVVARERRTLDGIVFRSRVEMTRYSQLRVKERAGMIATLKHESRFPLRVNGILVGHYTDDFDYIEDGVQVIEEVKTTGTAKATDYVLRRKLFEALYGVRVREVVMKS